MSSIIKRYKWDLLITVGLFAVFLYFGGFITGVQFVALIIIEISLSFDNAVVNAVVLNRLSRAWQKAFLYVGIWIAVFGMRFVFPVLIVSLTAHLGFGEVVQLALDDPTAYAHHLEAAHPEIATLGGVYLGMIFLTYFLGEHDAYWLGPVERLLTRIGKSDMLSGALMLTILLVISNTIGGDEGHKILFTGALSLAIFFAVKYFSELFESNDESIEEDEKTGSSIPAATGLAGLGWFVYLEVQDAAFSFDGVSGAFAITTWIPLIMAGLGVGALFVRSMTIHLVESGHLKTLPYLENGAHWAIGTLATCILASLYIDIPEWITAGISVAIIVTAITTSLRARQTLEAETAAA